MPLVEQSNTSVGRSAPLVKAGMRLVSALHVWLYRITGGRFLSRIGQAPVLLLTTTGRKTGQRRTCPLLYLQDGAQLVVVGSAGGAQTDPGWVRNLQAQPRVTVQVGGRVQPMRAELVQGAERARLWPHLVTLFPGFAEYQSKTARQLPVIVLRPNGGTAEPHSLGPNAA